jgi:hypothetical protein
MITDVAPFFRVAVGRSGERGMFPYEWLLSKTATTVKLEC